jgi:hypothetical protein
MGINPSSIARRPLSMSGGTGSPKGNAAAIAASSEESS